VIGTQDDVVNPADTHNFISEIYNEFTDFHLYIRPQLAQRIPLNLFEEKVKIF
jgi:hypothetical protein